VYSRFSGARTATEPGGFRERAPTTGGDHAATDYKASVLRDDFLVKAIEQLGQAIARICGLRDAKRTEDALQAVESAKRELPLVPGTVDQLSASRLARALGSPDLVGKLAELYRQEAELRYLLHDQVRAVRCLARSKALSAAAATLAQHPEEE
jgi:hypothetical protein